MAMTAVRALVLQGNLDTYGVVVTVTPPGQPPVTGTGMWATASRRVTTDDVYPVTDLRDRDADRAVVALPRATFPDVPLGTILVAALASGGEALSWRVDGIERIDPEKVHVVVVPA